MIDDAKKGAPPAGPTPANRLHQEMAVFNARRHIVPLLEPGILAEDIRERLDVAVEAGSRLGPEIAAHLHRLRDLRLGREESLIVIRAASNRAVERYVAARGRGGKLSREQLDNIDVLDVPAKTFAREFAVALGNQVTWKRAERGSKRSSVDTKTEVVDSRERFRKNAQVYRLHGAIIAGVDANEVLASHPEATTDDVMRALKIVEAHHSPRPTDSGFVRNMPTLVAIEIAKQELPLVVGMRIHGIPEALAGGKAARVGEMVLQSEFAAISQTKLDELLAKYPDASNAKPIGGARHEPLAAAFRALRASEEEYGPEQQRRVEAEFEAAIAELDEQGRKEREAREAKERADAEEAERQRQHMERHGLTEMPKDRFGRPIYLDAKREYVRPEDIERFGGASREIVSRLELHYQLRHGTTACVRFDAQEPSQLRVELHSHEGAIPSKARWHLTELRPGRLNGHQR